MVLTHAQSTLRQGEATLIACFISLSVPFAALAHAVRVAPQSSVYADTEVSTNILLCADAGYAREFEIAFSLPAESASNSIQVAFGRDATAFLAPPNGKLWYNISVVYEIRFDKRRIHKGYRCRCWGNGCPLIRLGRKGILG